MSMISVLNAACETTVTEVANAIEGEMKGVVAGHTRSGLALGAIHTEMTGAMSAFVGGTGGEGTKHLYWLDQGNGSGRIHGNPNLYLKDYGIWRKSVSTYAGIHFVAAIASHHGG